MSESLQTARFRLLLEQLGEEKGEEYGWQSEAAREVAMDPGLLGKVLRGERGVGGQQIARTVKALGIDSSFFYDPSLKDPRFRDFIGGAPQRRVDTSTAARVISEMGELLSASVQEELRHVNAHYPSMSATTLRSFALDLTRIEDGEMEPVDVTVRKGRRRIVDDD